MQEFIHVEPAPAARQSFAGWAVAQDPKVRTVSASTFAVPHCLFTTVPEAILLGARVDGHLYVFPDDEVLSSGELTSVARPEGFVKGHAVASGTPSGTPDAPGAPEVAEGSITDFSGPYAPDSEGPTDTAPVTDGGPDFCLECGRFFKGERGLATHRRAAHPGEYRQDSSLLGSAQNDTAAASASSAG